MIDDQVCDDVDPDGIATSDHGSKLIAVAGPRLQLVRNRLVPSPPLTTLDVLVRGRDLSAKNGIKVVN